jgi:predicted RNA-binding protein with PIN domain
VTVAKEGEQADPRVPAPAGLRPVLGFARFSAAAYATIARVLDDDGTFRARVAEVADEAEIGRASWLYLHRPVGWLDDPALLEDPPPPAPAPAGRPDDKAARLRKAAGDADAARKRAVEQLVEVRRSEAAVRAERDGLAAAIGRLEDERNAAVRRSKEVEAQLATTRRDLKLARHALMDAEAELAVLREQAVDAPTPPADRARATSAVAAASEAAVQLAAALADAAHALGTDGPAAPPVPGPTAERPAPGKKARGAKGKRPRRAHPALPPGTFDGTVEAHRALIADAANLLVVDGYNLARAAWTDLAPEEERRRTVALLDDVQARSGGRVVVLFDGDDAVTAPKASKNVRVRFSATGQTADEAIVDLLAGTPAATPVVVVSSDKAVARDAERQGAVAIGSRPFLRAAGR